MRTCMHVIQFFSSAEFFFFLLFVEDAALREER